MQEKLSCATNCTIASPIALHFPFKCSFFWTSQQNYGDPSGMGVMPSGLGLGYDRGLYNSGHGPKHGMRRQKSIGEAVCFFCLPLRSPVCLSSGPVEVYTVLTCLSVANNVLSPDKNF